MKRTVLACETVAEELRRLAPPELELRPLEQGLHRTPEKLRGSLQREIDRCDADEILLAYGLCGNGVAGLLSSRSRLVVPRADDCISLLLGSWERYRAEFSREPGTYWFSPGWIEYGRDPYGEYLRCLEKWDEETARWVALETMKGYRRVVLIDTGICPVSRWRDYAQRFARFFDLQYTEMSGSDALLRELLSARRAADRFVMVEPGQEIRPEMFSSPVSAHQPLGETA